MKTKLKIGQRVFDVVQQEWTKVKEIATDYMILENNTYFENYDNGKTTLTISLTEWNPWEGTGQFTSIDSEPQPQIGDMVWGWCRLGGAFIYDKLTYIDEDEVWAYQLGNKLWFKHISLTLPEWIVELIKEQKS